MHCVVGSLCMDAWMRRIPDAWMRRIPDAWMRSGCGSRDGMDWDDIRLLLEAGRAGSFSAAAERLNIHQASVSRRIAALEQRAGTALFTRSKTGAAPTDAGIRLIEKATVIAELVGDLERSLDTLK